MEEVHRLTIDLGRELRIRVDTRLVRAPVVLMDESVPERANKTRRRPVAPSRAGQFTWDDGALCAQAKLLQLFFGDIQSKGRDRLLHGTHSSKTRGSRNAGNSTVAMGFMNMVSAVMLSSRNDSTWSEWAFHWPG